MSVLLTYFFGINEIMTIVFRRHQCRRRFVEFTYLLLCRVTFVDAIFSLRFCETFFVAKFLCFWYISVSLYVEFRELLQN